MKRQTPCSVAFRFDLVERGLSQPLLAVYHSLCLCKRLTKASVAVGALCSVAADVVEAHCNSSVCSVAALALAVVRTALVAMRYKSMMLWELEPRVLNKCASQGLCIQTNKSRHQAALILSRQPLTCKSKRVSGDEKSWNQLTSELVNRCFARSTC